MRKFVSRTKCANFVLVTFPRRPLSPLRKPNRFFEPSLWQNMHLQRFLAANTSETLKTSNFKACVCFRGVSMPNLPRSSKAHTICPCSCTLFAGHQLLVIIIEYLHGSQPFLRCRPFPSLYQRMMGFKTCTASTITSSLQVYFTN